MVHEIREPLRILEKPGSAEWNLACVTCDASITATVPTVRLRHTQHHQQRCSALLQHAAFSFVFRRPICVLPVHELSACGNLWLRLSCVIEEGLKTMGRSGLPEALDGLATGDTGLHRIMKVDTKLSGSSMDVQYARERHRKGWCHVFHTTCDLPFRNLGDESLADWRNCSCLPQTPIPCRTALLLESDTD